MTLIDRIKCVFGFHELSYWEPRVGGREVRYCRRCHADPLEERSVVPDSLNPTIQRRPFKVERKSARWNRP